METPDFFIGRLKKAIENPEDKRVFVIKSLDKLRIEVTQGVTVVEDVEFPLDTKEHDEFEVDPKVLREKFVEPFNPSNIKELFNSLRNK